MIPAKHVKAISDLIDYCYDNVPYFGDSRSTAEFSPDTDTADLGKRACEALAYLQTITNMDEPTCAHEWVHTGTAYGGDDERYMGEGRVYCSKCGADGDG